MFGLLLVTACEGDVDTGEAGSSVPCGPVQCSAAQYCCDAACGICQDEDVACSETCG